MLNCIFPVIYIPPPFLKLTFQLLESRRGISLRHLRARFGSLLGLFNKEQERKNSNLVEYFGVLKQEYSHVLFWNRGVYFVEIKKLVSHPVIDVVFADGGNFIPCF